MIRYIATNRTVYFLLIFCLIGLTCKKKNETEKEEEKKLMICDGSPLELLWIKDIIADKSECKIYRGAFLTMYISTKETLFLLQNGASSLGRCNFILYNCEGKILSNFFLAGERENFYASHSNGKVIWQKL